MYNTDEQALFALKARKGLCSHAYIVDGAVGIGKLDFALSCASAMLCTGSDKPCGVCDNCRKINSGDHPDVFIVGKEKTAAIADVRELIRRASLKPNDADKQIFIVCNAGKLREDSQNALLKLFEEPPETVAIFLLTESRVSLLPTVLSRGQRIHLDGLPENEMRLRLREKFPNATSREIEETLSFAAGNFGAAAKYLAKENASVRAKAENIFTLAVNRRSYELAGALLVPKYKRDQLIAILSEFVILTVESEKRKFGIPDSAPEDGETALAVEKASKRALAAMCEVAQLCIISLENNANVTATVSKLSLDLITAAAR
jgi:DNA polymerase III delta prime subunit